MKPKPARKQATSLGQAEDPAEFRAKHDGAKVSGNRAQVVAAGEVALTTTRSAEGTKIGPVHHGSPVSCTNAEFRAKHDGAKVSEDCAQTIAAEDVAVKARRGAQGTKIEPAHEHRGSPVGGPDAEFRAKQDSEDNREETCQAITLAEVTQRLTGALQGTQFDPPVESSVSAPGATGKFDPLPARAPLTRRGRPTVMTTDLEEKVCMLISLGFTRRQAASYLGIGRMVINRAAERDEEFGALLSRAEDLCLVDPLLRIAGESRKNWRAAVWLIEHQQQRPKRNKTKASVAAARAEKARRQEERKRDALEKRAADAKFQELRSRFEQLVGRSK